MTFEFYHKDDLYGLEKYWAFHHYRNQDSGLINKHPELEKLLREEFRTIEDFKAKEKARKASEKEANSSRSNTAAAMAASHIKAVGLWLSRSKLGMKFWWSSHRGESSNVFCLVKTKDLSRDPCADFALPCRYLWLSRKFSSFFFLHYHPGTSVGFVHREIE